MILDTVQNFITSIMVAAMLTFVIPAGLFFATMALVERL